MDIEVYGVTLDENGKHYLNLSEEVPIIIKERPGGSIYYVADYLNQLKRSPFIVSMIGKDDKVFMEEANKAGLGDVIKGVFLNEDGSTAKTIHHVFNNPPYVGSAMYTDRLVLRKFDWMVAQKQLAKYGCEGNPVYIAGIFKTALHRNLESNLRELKQKGAMIFLDHGRLHLSQITDLQKDAIRDALCLADVYITTREELRQFIEIIIKNNNLASELDEKKDFGENSLQVLIEELGLTLPPIIVFRDYKRALPKCLIAIRNGVDDPYQVHSVEVNRVSLVSAKRVVGITNSFNAVFIDAFLKLSNVNEISAIKNCADKAQYCLEWLMKHPENTLEGAIHFWDTKKKTSLVKPNNSSVSPKKPVATPLEIFHNTLDKKLNLDEVKEFCFTIYWDFENLQGDTKRAKLMNLILILQVHDRIDELYAWLRRNRSEIKFDEI
jgi:hypothetical protein